MKKKGKKRMAKRGLLRKTTVRRIKKTPLKKTLPKVKKQATSHPGPAKCPSCGYNHVILKSLPGCPMCKVCSGCGKQLMKCHCKEGE